MIDPGDRRQFLLAVAGHAPQLRVARGRLWSGEYRRRSGSSPARFLDPGKHVVDALVEPGRQHVLGGDDVEALEARHAGKQIVIRQPEPARIRGLIRDRDDDVAIRGVGFRPPGRDEQGAESVLVDGVRLPDGGFEQRECRRQEAGQPQQPLGATVDVRAWFEAADHQPVEGGDRLVPAAEARRRTQGCWR